MIGERAGPVLTFGSFSMAGTLNVASCDMTFAVVEALCGSQKLECPLLAWLEGRRTQAPALGPFSFQAQTAPVDRPRAPDLAPMCANCLFVRD